MPDWSLSHAAYDARYPPGAGTGCQGIFLIIEDDGQRPATAECDVCGLHVGVARSVLAGAGPAPDADWLQR